MKTTLELPDELYLEVKARAALRRRKIKDYVAEGLRLALEADLKREHGAAGPLAVFDEVRAEPFHTSAEIHDMIERASSARQDDWRESG